MSVEPLDGTGQPPRTDEGVSQPLAQAPGQQAPEQQAPEQAEGFFHADGDLLVPAAFARSPWGPVLHGRLIGGLTAHAAEQARAAAPEMICSRLTVDMFRSVPLAPVRVRTRPLRAGRRIAVFEVTIEQDDGPVGLGTVMLLRPSDQPDGNFRPAPAWDAAAPEGEAPEPMLAAANRRWVPPWQSWRVGGGGRDGRDGRDGALSGGIWIRDTHPLITGAPLTSLVRLSMAADMVSPVANSSDRGLSFINADYTVYLSREPQGEYVGVQPGGHISERGVAVGHCVLHDLQGPVGFAATAAVANPTLGAPSGNSGRR